MQLRDLAEFLTLFRTAYAIGTYFRHLSFQELIDQQDRLRGQLTEVLQSGSRRDLEHEFFNQPLGDDELQIIEIKKESPLEIFVGGSLLLLTFGVILSGGEISYENGKLRCKLPPLGQGIKRLRTAFGRNEDSSSHRIDEGMQKLHLKVRTPRFLPEGDQREAALLDEIMARKPPSQNVPEA